MTVFRENILNNIYSRIQTSIHNKEAGLLEITGDPGAGKSILLGQVNEYLRLSGLNVQHISLSVSSQQSIVGLLLQFTKEAGLSIPIAKNNQLSGIAMLHQLISIIRDSTKSSLLICIDDAHLLQEESLKTIRKVFAPVFTQNSIFCILTGRPGWQQESAIVMSGYTRQEGIQYLKSRTNAEWEPLYVDQLDWILETVRSNPLHLSLLVDHLIDNGKLSENGYIAFLDEMKQLPVSTRLRDQVKVSFDIDSISTIQRDLLSVLAIAWDHRLHRDQIELLFPDTEVLEDDISALIINGWIVIQDNHVGFAHPLITSIILESLLPDQKKMWTRTILRTLKPTKDNLAHYLFNRPKLKPNEIKLLDDWALKLSRSVQFQTALTIWEKLYNQTPDPKMLHNMGRMYYELRQLDEAESKFKKILTLPEYTNHHSPHYYLAKCNLMKRKYKEADYHFDMMLKSLKPDDKTYHAVITEVIKFYQISNNLPKFKKLFKTYKDRCEHSTKHRYDYIYLVCWLDDKIDMGFDILKLANEGLSKAKKINDIEKIRFFYMMLAICYERVGEIKQAYRVVKQVQKIEGDEKILEQDAFDIAAIARIEFNSGYHNDAVLHYMQAAGIFQKVGDIPSYLDCLQSICSLYGANGNIARLQKTQIELEAGVKDHDFGDVMVTHYTISQLMAFQGDYDNAVRLLNKLYRFTESIENISMSAHIQGSLAQVLYSKDKKKAWKHWDEMSEYFIKTNQVLYLPKPYFNFGWELVVHNDKNALKLIVESWRAVSGQEDTYQYQYIHAAFDIMNGNFSSGLTRVSLLEKKLDGKYMWEWKKLYEWLATQSLKPTVRTRYAFRAAMTESICQNAPPKRSVKEPKDLSTLDQLYQGWSRAVSTNHIMDTNLIEDFIQELDRQEQFKETLKLWDVDCRDLSNLFQYPSGKPIIINLLGEPELFINYRKLNSKDWTSKKALEVLIYVLIRSWRHKKSVDYNDLLQDLWEPPLEKLHACRLVRNNMMFRIRKIFSGFDIKMFYAHHDEVIFNWESGLYRLDIELFVEYIKDAKKLISEGNHDSARIKLESALSLYRGELATGFDGMYLESDRAYFASLELEAKDMLASL